ncbi:MAG: hypothetical protein AABW51_03015 [Nanoarchaeota archaeon]
MKRIELLVNESKNKRQALRREEGRGMRKVANGINEIIECRSNGHPNAQRIGNDMYCSVCNTSYLIKY